MTAALDLPTTRLLGLLEELRGARGLGRARTLAQATQVLRRLSPQQRRELALRVAEQVAPDLVPRIDAAAARGISAQQVGQLLDLLRRLDGDQLAEVARAVREGDLADPEVRAAAAELADEALSAIAPVDAEPLDAEPVEVEPDLVRRIVVPPLLDVADPTATPVLPQPVEPEPVAPELELEAIEDPIDDGAMHDDTADEELEDETAALAAEAEAELAAEQAARADLLAATPDGWRRRRLLLSWVQDATITDDEAVGLVASLGRTSDRAWVVGALLDRGLVTIEQARPLVDARTLTRLGRRAA